MRGHPPAPRQLSCAQMSPTFCTLPATKRPRDLHSLVLDCFQFFHNQLSENKK